ncbi:MAG: hypothetical protein ACI9OU_002640 [Candidatus Promineifilaceae bacterium]|jgi:hypothetical protein
MTSLHFGSSEAPLYGAFQPAVTTLDRDHAVLLCAPLGHEYMRTHWLLRRLATALSSSGYASLCFDYNGYGDSGGDSGVGTPSLWADNISMAADELVALSGARHLSVVTLRAASLLVSHADLSAFACETLVMLDPVASGDQWISDLEALQQRQNLRHAGGPAMRTRPASPEQGLEEYLGAVFPTDTKSSLQELRYANQPDYQFRKIRTINSAAMTPDPDASRVWQAWAGDYAESICADSLYWADAEHARGCILPPNLPSALVCLI